MKIAVVVRSLAIGGMERVAVSLSETFAKEDHDSHLIYFIDADHELPVSQTVHLHNFKLHQSMKSTILGYAWKVVSQLLNIIIRKSYFVWAGLFTGYLFNKKLSMLEKKFGSFDLIIFRGQGTFEMLWPIHDKRFVFVNESVVSNNKHTFLNKLYAKILFTNRNISSVSQGVKESFDALREYSNFPVNKNVHITNPIDIDSIKALSSSYTPSYKNKYLVSVGRFHPIKNFSLLIEAYAYAKKHLGLTYDLVLVGDGPDRKNIETTIKNHKLNDSIYLPGYNSNPYPWMKNAELFILTSKMEGLGMVLLESMSCGTDIVATESPGGVKEIMTGDLKHHISQAGTISLAKTIMSVLENPLSDFSNYLAPFEATVITKQFIQNFSTKKK